jgi:hypothetical protein
MIDEETRNAFLDHLKAKNAGHEGDPCPVCGHDNWRLEGPNHIINDGPIKVEPGNEPCIIGTISLILMICNDCFHVRMFALAPIINRYKAWGLPSSPRSCGDVPISGGPR